jgi:hypothetical protein
MAEIDRPTVPAAVPMLLIERCRDPGMWYAGMVGELVQNLGMFPDGDWRSREPYGYINSVKAGDARPVVVTIHVAQ